MSETHVNYSDSPLNFNFPVSCADVWELQWQISCSLTEKTWNAGVVTPEGLFRVISCLSALNLHCSIHLTNLVGVGLDWTRTRHCEPYTMCYWCTDCLLSSHYAPVHHSPHRMLSLCLSAETFSLVIYTIWTISLLIGDGDYEGSYLKIQSHIFSIWKQHSTAGKRNKKNKKNTLKQKLNALTVCSSGPSPGMKSKFPLKINSFCGEYITLWSLSTIEDTRRAHRHVRGRGKEKRIIRWSNKRNWRPTSLLQRQETLRNWSIMSWEEERWLNLKIHQRVDPVAEQFQVSIRTRVRKHLQRFGTNTLKTTLIIMYVSVCHRSLAS